MSKYFIVCVAEDREWAVWIRDQLKALGNSALIYEHPTENSASYSWVERQLESGGKIVSVLSNAYLSQAKGVDHLGDGVLRACYKKPDAALIVIVEPYEMSNWSEHFSQCEIFGIPESWARKRLRDFIRSAARPRELEISENVLI